MKRIGIIGLLNIVALTVLAQHSNSTLVASISGTDRLSIVKNSINIPVWHEKTFWPLYEDYLKNMGDVSSLTYRSLEDLAKVDKTASNDEALEQAQKMISSRHDMLTVREQYFAQIGTSFNGIIALQFLQTEALLDMMESSRIYEQTYWRNFRFHSGAIPYDQLKTAKHNTMSLALSISPEQEQAFWEVYTAYEEACDALLGDDYSVISLYAGEPTDFTPALAKRLGYDFLKIMRREVKLKEEYFEEMNKAVGPSLAARFLAWEDFYSQVSKMYVWAEN